MRRSTRPLTTLLPILFLALAGCSQFTVRADHDPAADFSRLRTYAWLPLDQAAPADQSLPDRYLDKKLREAVDENLGKKGYRPAGNAPADFLLNYRLARSVMDEVHGDPGGGEPVPISGVEILLAGGIALGLKKLNNFRKKIENQETKLN